METWSASLQDMSSYSQHSDLIFRCSLSLPCQLAAKWTTCSAWQVAPHHTAPPPRPASTDARDGPRATAPFLVCAVPTPRPVWMRLTIIAATATSAGGSEWIAAPAFFFSLLSILYAMIINTPIYYILCAMPVLFRDGKMHANAMDNVGDWQCNPGHSQLPGTFQMLCVHLLSSSIYILTLS